MPDLMQELGYGGDTWWEDSRNISALALWLLENNGTARQMYEVFEYPDNCQELWTAFREWVAQADA